MVGKKGQGKRESYAVILSNRCGEFVPIWQTESLSRTMKRERMRMAAVDKIVEPALSFQIVPRKLEGWEEWNQAEWESYAWQPKVQNKTRSPNGAGVNTFARRLMAIERIRILRSKVSYYCLPTRKVIATATGGSRLM